LNQRGGDSNKLLVKPSDLYDNAVNFKKALQGLTKIEFGNKFYLPSQKTFQLEIKPQPSFNKNFNLLIANLIENERNGILNIICSESEKQMERLRNIFEELDPTLKTQSLHIGIRGGFIDSSLQVACYTDHQIFDRYHRFKTKSK